MNGVRPATAGPRDEGTSDRRSAWNRVRSGSLAAAAIAVSVALCAGSRAAEECGPADAGRTLVCSPGTYDPATDGNIFYGPDDAFEGDLGIRLTGDLSVRYDRGAPGDDVLVRPDDGTGRSIEDRSRYSAVAVAPGGPDYEGDIAVSSSADIATNGRGILVYHHGASGALRLDVAGGRIAARDGRYGYAISTDHTGSGDLDVAAGDVAIEAAGNDAVGILAYHEGTGDIGLAAEDVGIEAAGDEATGMVGVHLGTGAVAVAVRNGRIVAAGRDRGDGVYGRHRGTGDLAIDVRGARIAATGQDRGNGIWTWHSGSGDLAVATEDVAVEGAGNLARGMFAAHGRTGAVAVAVRAGRVAAAGRDRGDGVFTQHTGSGDIDVAAEDAAIEAAGDLATGIFALHRGTGALGIEVRGGRIAATGGQADGIYATASGGGIDIVAEDVAIEIRGTDHSNGIVVVDEGGGSDIAVAARNAVIEVRGEEAVDGIFVKHSAGDAGPAAGGAGDSRVEVRGGRIAAAGAAAGGIRVVHEHGGGIAIDVRDAAIAVSGDGALGIGARHPGTGDGAVSIAVAGGSVDAEGPDSSGISVGALDAETGAVEAAGGTGADGYRRQSVTVNGRVRGGGGAGVRLVGGGRVEIGPRGSVGAASGVAVRAEGDGAALHVEAQLDGRRRDEAIAGAIRNDRGRTTVAVNGVVLHDGMTGATGFRAPNGARDVTLRRSATVAGRAFTAADFAAGYAPRAAVYEALPGFLLRLDDRHSAGERLRNAGSRAWVRVSGGGGSHEPDGASVGAAWDFTRFEAEAGLDLALSREGNVTGSVSLRHVRGSADVSAPTGGGKIEAAGFGAVFGAAWTNADGYYAEGRVSVTRYETDLRSDFRGGLKEGAGAAARSLGIEAGRRLRFGGDLRLTPRAWLTGTEVAMEGFRDAVGSRVSPEDAARVAAGAGIAAGTERTWDGGARRLVLRGHLGVERALGDARTATEVSGERLGAGTARTRTLLGLGGVYLWNRWSLGGEISVSGPGSNDSGYAAGLRIATTF